MVAEMNELEKFLTEDEECIRATVFNNMEINWINENELLKRCGFFGEQKVYEAIKTLYSKNFIEINGHYCKLSKKGMNLLKETNRYE